MLKIRLKPNADRPENLEDTIQSENKSFRLLKANCQVKKTLLSSASAAPIFSLANLMSTLGFWSAGFCKEGLVETGLELTGLVPAGLLNSGPLLEGAEDLWSRVRGRGLSLLRRLIDSRGLVLYVSLGPFSRLFSRRPWGRRCSGILALGIFVSSTPEGGSYDYFVLVPKPYRISW